MSEVPLGRPEAEGSWVAVAYVLRPHGLDGTVRLKPLTRTPEELLEAPVRTFRLRRDGQILGTVEIQEMWAAAGDVLLATARGVSDRTAAEALKGGELVIEQSRLWKAAPDSYYIHDLEGLAVRAAEGGADIGRVLTARDGIAHDYLVLSLHGVAAREVLLPLIPQFVPTVDIAAGYVSVRLPEGLVNERPKAQG